MTARILQGDCLDVLPTLARGSVDCMCTSPPYWNLRSYLPQGDPLKSRELGSEPTPEAYVEAMVRVFRLVRTAMADHATCWINCGDTFASGCSGESRLAEWGAEHARGGGHSDKAAKHQRPPAAGLAPGNLCLIPWRLALALQADGWIVRSVVAWVKPSPMPQSLSGWRWTRCRVKVKGQALKTDSATHTVAGGMANGKPHRVTPDWLAQWADCPGCPKCEANAGYVLRRGSWRPTSSWEPVLLLAKRGGYFADGEAVRVPQTSPDNRDNPGSRSGVSREEYEAIRPGGELTRERIKMHNRLWNPAGANLRDVWTIPAEPLKEKHYAAFPTELVYRCLAAGTSAKGYCPRCGAPWCRVVERVGGPPPGCHRQREDFHETTYNAGAHPERMLTGGALSSVYAKYGYPESKTLGWRPTCSHGDLPPRPGLVLDPFCGSGRVGLQCQRMGLDFVGVELSPEYAALAERLLHDHMPLFQE